MQSSEAPRHQSPKLFSRIVIVIGAVLVAMLVFWAGLAVGYKQAEFSYRWDRHYAEVFGGKGSPFFMSFRHDGDDQPFPPTGAAGTIVGVHLPSVAVKGPDQAEKVVLIGSSTQLRLLHGTASTTDLRIGSFLIALGQPDANGRIQATFIRILPPPSPSDISTSTQR